MKHHLNNLKNRNRKNFLLVFSLFFTTLTLLVTDGCNTEESAANHNSGDSTVVNKNRLILKDAQTKAVMLVPDLAQSKVKELLGDPDSTSSQTYGTQTQQPWVGVKWLYVWNETEKYYIHTTTLSIVFSRVGDSWVVNNWNWDSFRNLKQ